MNTPEYLPHSYLKNLACCEEPLMYHFRTMSNLWNNDAHDQALEGTSSFIETNNITLNIHVDNAFKHNPICFITLLCTKKFIPFSNQLGLINGSTLQTGLLHLQV